MAGTGLPSIELLRQLLAYDPETGDLTWKQRTGKWSSRWNKRHAGNLAGTIDNNGYRAVKIFDRPMHAHRIIWAIVYGRWPESIDHINGNRTDNKLCNLRDVSHVINQRNQGRHNTNTSGRTGVHWSKVPQRWVAYIKVDDRQLHLGLFDKFEDAVRARKAAERKYGFTGRQ